MSIQEQRTAALALANAVRGERAALKRRIRQGGVLVGDVLTEASPLTDGCTLAEVLRSQPGWGPVRTSRLLARLDVSEQKLVGDLTARQRAVLIGALT